MKSFDVFLDDVCIDVISYSDSAKVDAEEVRMSLINHDGYDSNIEVEERVIGL